MNFACFGRITDFFINLIYFLNTSCIDAFIYLDNLLGSIETVYLFLQFHEMTSIEGRDEMYS